MSGKDRLRTINENGIGETKALDALGNLADLLARMRARIALERPQRIHWLDCYF